MGLWLGYYNIECSKASINRFDENANGVLVNNFLLKNKIGRFRSMNRRVLSSNTGQRLVQITDSN